MADARSLLFVVALVACHRTEVRKTDEERKLDRGPTKFVELAKGNYERGFFTDGAFAVHAPGAFACFDLMTHQRSDVPTTIPDPALGERLMCDADAKGILCLYEHDRRGIYHPGRDLEPLLLDGLDDGKPRKLADPIPGEVRDIRADEGDWFVLRSTAPGGWGEIVAISRPSGNRRSIAFSDSLKAFAIDESRVYWLEDGAVFRKKKLGGPTDKVAPASEPGEIFVRGDFVHLRTADGVISRVAKSGGTFAKTTDVADTLAHDEAGYCWCNATRVYCRGADDVSRELVLPAQSKCAWMSISRSHVVVQVEGALWVADRP